VCRGSKEVSSSRVLGAGWSRATAMLKKRAGEYAGQVDTQRAIRRGLAVATGGCVNYKTKNKKTSSEKGDGPLNRQDPGQESIRSHRVGTAKWDTA